MRRPGNFDMRTGGRIFVRMGGKIDANMHLSWHCKTATWTL